MICPGCKGDLKPLGARVESLRVAYRERRCGGCGKRWPTVEKCIAAAVVKVAGLNRGLMIQPRDGLNRVLNHGGPLRGGLDPVSGSASSPIPEVISSPEDASFLEASDAGAPPRDPPKRGRGDAAAYPEDFEQLWRETGRHGNKHPAFTEWALIKTTVTLTTLIERWREWEQTDQWRAGYVPHLRKWLHVRGWQDAPPEHEFRNRTTTQARGAARNVDHGLEWLTKRGGEG